MAFALVHFYKKNTRDIIPYSDTILNDKQKEKNLIELEGLKTLVMWTEPKENGRMLLLK